jgi:hypothetical protein
LQLGCVQVYCTDAGVVINAVRRNKPYVKIYAFVIGNCPSVKSWLRIKLEGIGEGIELGGNCGSSNELSRLGTDDSDDDDLILVLNLLNWLQN